MHIDPACFKSFNCSQKPVVNEKDSVKLGYE